MTDSGTRTLPTDTEHSTCRWL